MTAVRGRRWLVSFLATLPGLIRQHRLFCAVFGAGLVLRLIVMAAYRPAILVRQDSFDYLWDAVRLTPDPVRPDGYAFFLALLRPFHSLLLIVSLQHLMGLAIAAMVSMVLVNRGVPGWGATLAAAPVLFDPRQLDLEHSVMSDTLATFLMLAALVVLLLRVPSSSLRPPSVGRSATAGLLMGVAGLVRPITLPLFLLVAACLLLQRAGWRRSVAALAVGALPLAAYGLWFSTFFGSVALTNSDGLFLWSRTMTFANCATIKPPAGLRALCPGRQPASRKVAPHPSNSWSTLLAQPSPRVYLWDRTSWLWQPPTRQLVPDVAAFTPARNSRAMKFAVKAIAAQPLGYARAVTEGVALTFLDTDHSLRFPSALVIQKGLNYSYQVAAVRGYVGPAKAAGLRQGISVHEPYAYAIQGYESRLYFPGVLFALVLSAGLAGILIPGRRSGAAVLLWACAVITIVLPSAEHMFNYRYALPALPLACMALALVINGRTGARGRPRSPEPDTRRQPARDRVTVG